MAVAFETLTTTTTGTGTATNLVGTKPIGTAQNDLLLAYFSWRDATIPTNATVTPPSGWTAIGALGATDNASIGDRLYYKVAGGSEPADYTFTLSETQQCTLEIVRVSGVDTASPINASSLAVNDVATSTNLTATGITTTADGCFLFFFSSSNGANTHTPPSGMTERADLATTHATTNVTITIATETQTSAGATGTRTATQGGAVRSLARLIALKQATFTGAAAVSLQKLTAVATGTVGTTGVTGTAAVSLMALTAAAAGTGGITGQATTGGATAGSLACSPPSDAAAGNILVAFVAWRTSVLPTPPVGWALIASELHGSTAFSIAAYWRAYSISDTTYTWTFSASTAAAIAMRGYAGIDLADPIDTFGSVETVVNIGATVLLPSLNASAASAPLLVAAAMNGQRTFTMPADLTERHDIKSTNGITDVALTFGDGLTATAGATGTRTVTGSGNAYSVGIGIVLRFAAGGAPGGGSGGTGTGIIGVNRVEDGTTFSYNNYLMAWGPFRAADLAQITGAKIKVQGGGTAQNVRLAIYANEYTGGIDQPGALVGAGAELTISGAQAKAEVSIPAPAVTLARDGDYWLTLWWGPTGNAILYAEYRLGGAIRKTSTYSSTANPPSAFGTYSTGSVGGGTPHLYLEYKADLPGGAAAGQIILEPGETVLSTAVSNHYAGPHRWRGNGAFVAQAMKDDYERWDWNSLEGAGSGTTSGTFTFSAIRAEINAATAAGRRYAFRIRAETNPGVWVVPSDLNGITGSGFYNNATFQTRWKKIIDALGAEFDGQIAWFEAGPGQYGEWVAWSGTAATRDFLVRTPINAFPKTPFVINVADPVSLELAFNISPRAGVRNDIYSFPSAANQITGIQSQVIRARLYRASQNGRLFLGEPGPQVSPSMLVYLNQIRYYRINTVGNANWDPTYASLSTQAKADVNEAYRVMGYRIVLARVDAPAVIDADVTQAWRFYWHNRNVGWVPQVGVWKAEVRLRSGASTIVATRTLVLDVRFTLAPTGVAPIATNESLRWNGVANGTYTLDVRVTNTILGPIALGNSTLVSSGWYSVGGVTVASDATVAVSMSGAFRVTGTPFTATIAALMPAAPFIPATSSGHRQRLQIGLYRSAGGQLVLDASHLADGAQWSTNQNGFRDLRLPLDLNTERAYALYAERGTLHMEVNSGPYTVWEGRLTDPSLRVAERSGVDLTALGYLDALNDLLYTALWSTTDLGQWRVARRGANSSLSAVTLGCIPDRYTFEIAEYVYIAPKKNAKHGSTAYLGDFAVATAYVQIPSGSTRQITRVSFTYEFVGAGSEWYADAYTIVGNGYGAFVWGIGPTSGTGTINVTVPAADGVMIRLYRVGTDTNFEFEDGDVYVKITNLRIKTTTGNASVDAVARDLITTIAAINPTQIANDDTAIAVAGPDLADLLAEDSYGLELLTRLAAQSADSSGLAPVVRMLRGRRLEVRSRSSIRGRAFLIDIDDLQIQQSRDNLINSVYARYKGAGDRMLRSARATSADSVSRYGIRRERMLEVDTTSVTQTTRYRDAVLLDGVDPLPRAKISVRKVYNERGVRVPNWLPEAWDTITITNLPPGIGDFDRIRTFVIAETTYTAATDTLEVSPESPLPTLDLLIAKGKR